MATISKRGNTYQITVSNGSKYDGSQNRVTLTFKPDPQKTKKENERALKKAAIEFEEKVKSGNYLNGAKITLTDYSKMWLENYAKQQMEITSYERAEDIFRLNILPRLGQLKISEIKPVILIDFYEDLASKGYKKNGKYHPYAASTIKRIHQTLSSAFSIAVQWQLIESNPCDRVKPPKKKTAAKVNHMKRSQAAIFLEAMEKPYEVVSRGRVHKDGTPSQEHRTLKNVPYQLKVFYTLALFSGMRRGELIALTWDSVDFENRIITIDKSAARARDGQITKKRPKTKTSYRKVAVPEGMIEMLKELRKEQLKQRLLVGTYWEDHGFLFTQDNGRQMSIDWPNKVFKLIVKRHNAICENEEELLPPDITLHGLRHTAATLLIADHVDVKTVSRFLGHAETSTTMNIYAHALDEAVEAIPSTFDKLFTANASKMHQTTKKEAASN